MVLPTRTADSFDKYALDLKTTPSDVYNVYVEDRGCLFPALERLIELGGYSDLLKILQHENENLFTSTQVLERVAAILLEAAEAIKTAGLLESYIVWFSKLAFSQKFPFQIFLGCKIVSELLIQNGTLISKAHTTKYFKTLGSLFKRASSFSNYLNCVNILYSLDSIKIGCNELQFLKACAKIKAEPCARRLFCGVAIVQPDAVLQGKELPDDEFVPNENWLALIDAVNGGSKLTFGVEVVAFLKKNGIAFSISPDNMIEIKGYVHSGLATKIFDIAKLYEPERLQTEIVVEKRRQKREVRVLERAPLPDQPIKTAEPAHEFASRFSLAHKKFKWFYSQFSPAYVDDCLEERNAKRLAAFEQTVKAHAARREFYQSKLPIVTELSASLAAHLREVHLQEMRELAEKQRLEAEQKAKEEEMKKWKNQRASTPSYSCIPTPTAPGAYVPPSLANIEALLRKTAVSKGVQTDDGGAAYVPPSLRKDKTSDEPSNK